MLNVILSPFQHEPSANDALNVIKFNDVCRNLTDSTTIIMGTGDTVCAMVCQLGSTMQLNANLRLETKSTK